MLPPLENVAFFDLETTDKQDPWKQKIITVQVRYRGKTKIWKEWEIGEQKCLIGFLDDFLREIPRKETSFVGYNVLKFDVWFLDERLRQLKILNEWKWNAIHNYLHWIDLYQLLGDAYSKAVVWYSSKGVKQEIENADVPLLYSEKKYEQIIQYVENEMKGMEAVYQGILNEPFYFELLKLRQKVGDS